MSSTNRLAGPRRNAVGVDSRRLFVVAVLAIALAACTQAPPLGNRSGFLGGVQQASVQANRHLALPATANRTAEKHAPVTNGGASGLASFYGEESGVQTASGEKYDSHELTAAHRTLPFGTRLRVTNVSNGRSVIVRVNDRGPFVPGRVVDVSNSAAQGLGMTSSGTAKVKVDVVQ